MQHMLEACGGGMWWGRVRSLTRKSQEKRTEEATLNQPPHPLACTNFAIWVWEVLEGGLSLSCLRVGYIWDGV